MTTVLLCGSKWTENENDEKTRTKKQRNEAKNRPSFPGDFRKHYPVSASSIAFYCSDNDAAIDKHPSIFKQKSRLKFPVTSVTKRVWRPKRRRKNRKMKLFVLLLLTCAFWASQIDSIPAPGSMYTKYRSLCVNPNASEIRLSSFVYVKEVQCSSKCNADPLNCGMFQIISVNNTCNTFYPVTAAYFAANTFSNALCTLWVDSFVSTLALLSMFGSSSRIVLYFY